ncbi:MAG: TIGR02302 family protein, partial [Hyphomicrobiaceae bacterium]
MSKTPVVPVPPPLPASVRPSPNSNPTFRRKVAFSRASLYFERLWPRLWLPLAVVGMFAIVSLAGLWPQLSQNWHVTLLAAFGLALFASLFPAIRLGWPTRGEAVRHIEIASELPHRPASSYEDQLAPVARDMAARRLWEAHRNRLKTMFKRMRVGNPSPRVDRRDPFALRALLALGVLLLLVLAGDRAYDRLTAPFRLGPSALSATARLDAWISPPPYTGRPPMMLADGSRPIADILLDPNRRNEVPFGSQLVVRSSGEGHERFTVEIRTQSGETRQIEPVGRDKDQKQKQTTATSPATATPTSTPVLSDVTEFRAEIQQSGTIRVLSGSREVLSWPFNVIPDQPPRIALTDPHEVTPRGALKLNYKAEDDYGVVSAEARFARVLTDEEKVRAAARKGPRPPLERPPRFDLRLPKLGAKMVEGKAFQDPAAHPWAGMKVLMWLEARDQANQVGKSEPIEMTFPSRKFRKPLARAVVEQRRELASDSLNRQRVIQALDLITYAPERFIEDRAVYLGLRSVHWRLKHDKSRAAARTAVDQLWHIALRIEDGNMSDIERRLRDAQDALSKALKDGADEKEIKRLTEELREAMNRYLESLMRQAEQQGRLDQMPDRDGTERDLDQMLKDLEQMAKEGSREQAQQLLSELQELLDQLQSGRFNQGQNQQNGQMNQMLDRFGDIIKKQQGLLDDTFKE